MRNFLKNSIDILFDKSLIVSGLCLIILTAVDISNINEWKANFFGINDFQYGRIIYYLTMIFAFIFGIISVLSGKEISKLEKDNNEKSIKINDLESKLNEVVNETNELFNSYLKLLVKNLGFTHKERISVYKVYQNRFKLIGRTSVDPILMEIGRSEYPLNEGFIGKGWREGEYFINDLPEITTGRNGLNNYYNRVNSIHPIPRDVIENMKMRSRTFFIYRINGYDGNPRAVLVFESLNENSFAKEFIIDKLNGVKQPLVMFIEKNNGILITENLLGI
ncbi:hypothetical protein OA93_00425 [Flavobacterium sp. KMS]|uniref:hypothetical protein n=1 Tax=Flavobacterium sp. KMS TaxID=1566023 RepID=UPI00057DC601|nr:hypothetical protein [Flavobacterium sp. KMS]KIC00117.1 hypothetical protein OA93_00425 [Flavobacterium sp. KMS]